jgi:hypothetical protein
MARHFNRQMGVKPIAMPTQGNAADRAMDAWNKSGQDGSKEETRKCPYSISAAKSPLSPGLLAASGAT